jgi:DNA-binding response OmpR family regulator
MAVDVALDGQNALERACANSYDVIVLDRDLPVIHGDEVCRRLVQDGCRARILMLTAATMVQDRVEGLNLGADDYLTSPSPLRSWWHGSGPSSAARSLRSRPS